MVWELCSLSRAVRILHAVDEGCKYSSIHIYSSALWLKFTSWQFSWNMMEKSIHLTCWFLSRQFDFSQGSVNSLIKQSPPLFLQWITDLMQEIHCVVSRVHLSSEVLLWRRILMSTIQPMKHLIKHCIFALIKRLGKNIICEQWLQIFSRDDKASILKYRMNTIRHS